MDFLTGKTEKKTMSISEILEGDFEGKEVRVNGAIHKIRDMGDVAFVVLRNREGLVQTVYEEGVTDIALKELNEEATVEVCGVVAAEERAPQGFEIRLKEVKLLSKPLEPMPISINKWKMNTSLETRLDLRPLSLRHVKERAKFRIQEGIVRSAIICMGRDLPRFARRKSVQEAQRAVLTYSDWNIFTSMRCWHRVRSFINR